MFKRKNIQNLVVTALENPKYQWRTVEGISKETKLSNVEVKKVIVNHPEVVRSYYLGKNEAQLYTTRKHFQQKAAVRQKIMGIIRNRLD